MSPLRLFAEAGVFGWLLLFLGLIGLVAGLGAVAMLAARQRAAFALGIVAMLLGSLIAGVAVVGNWYARRSVDMALASAAIGSQAERIQRAGYEEARSVAKLGLVFAFLPLLCGAIAALGGARRRKEPPVGGIYAPPEAHLESDGGARVVTAGLVLGVGTISYLGAVMPLLAPLPGRDWALDDPRWTVLDATEQVMVGQELESHCRTLEEGLDGLGRRGLALLSPAAAPDLQAAAGRCVDERIRRIQGYRTASARKTGFEELAKASLVLDEEQRKKVRQALDDVKPDEAAGSGSATGDGKAEPSAIAGRLAPEIIQRVVRQHMGRMRACYEKGLRKNPALEGKVMLRFVIGLEGSVTEADGKESALADPEVVDCVVEVAKRMSFPQPEGGVVTVRYPLVFNQAR